ILIIIEILRFNELPPFGKLIKNFFIKFQDEKDNKNEIILSYIYLILGISLPLWINNVNKLRESSYIGLISLGLGDSFASLIGSLIGKFKWPNSNKTIEGSISMVIGMMIGFYILDYYMVGISNLEMLSWSNRLLSSILCALFEGIVDVNDNLFMADDETTQQNILKQVEFYFSESNLLNDKFLFTTQNANDGWVPIQTISQFERMKKYRPIEIIVKSLRNSKDLLEVSENGEMVRRKIPLPKNYNEIQLNINKRSIFVEKLPTNLNLDDLLTFFQLIAPVNQVRMKKNKDKIFTGCCIVEFKNSIDAEKILNSENKLKYNNEIELEIISKSAYDESKAQKFGERRGNKGGSKNKRRGRKDDKDDESTKDDVRKRDASPVREEKPEKERED
ncbi:hypothetical protein C6P40_002474, partial [Pichia californica]